MKDSFVFCWRKMNLSNVINIFFILEYSYEIDEIFYKFQKVFMKVFDEKEEINFYD